MKKYFFFIFLISLNALSTVEDPGIKGLRPPMGIDMDKDGVRDDLQFWIEETFADKKAKLGALQLARAILKSMQDYKDKTKAVSNTQKIIRAQNCIIVVQGKEVGSKSIKNIQSRMINTRDRKFIQERIDGSLKDQTFEAIQPSEQDCEFKQSKDQV